MLIIADENMPFAEEYFGRLGEVRLVSGREINAETVREADLLMVRSVTRVNEELLGNSQVKFVGTATIGTDHIDQGWLASRGIGFASAPGCNAESVAQYIAAALCYASCQTGRSLSNSSLGVVGVGNCGSRVARVAEALGMEVKLNDPPLARETGDARYLPMLSLMSCDFLTLHVPLTHDGQDATFNLINENKLNQMPPGSLLINASRGGVVNEKDLNHHLDEDSQAACILDAWENEPGISPVMLRRAMLGTPHIAGYSLDGKVRGTQMIYEAACSHLGRESEAVTIDLSAPTVDTLEIEAEGRTMDSVLADVVLRAYPIHRDSGDLKRLAWDCTECPTRIAEGFDGLRKKYPVRREFAAMQVKLHHAPDEWKDRLQALGFTLA